jgi:CheY-like chemotaxis protein
MARLALIHWKAAEAEPRLARLRSAGHDVSLLVPQSQASLKVLAEHPPQAILIDLSRQPSTGIDIAILFRRWKALRAVPLLFVEGAEEKVDKARALLPDAVFTPWSRIAGALKKALAAPTPSRPVVPDAMAGYSGTPLPKKLGFKPWARVLLIDAPDAFEELLTALPEGVELVRTPRGAFDRVLLFAYTRDDLVRRFDSATARIAPKGHLWVAWPKKTSRMAADLTQEFVRAYGLGRQWVDFKICAIDADWSGLCFARRES